MYIKSLYVQNFKRFEKKEFSFHPQFNLAIGNNASGKSTLLHSLQVALGGYLQCLDIPAAHNYRRQFKEGEAYVRWNKLIKDYVRNEEPTLISARTFFSNFHNDVLWKRVMLKNNTTSHNKNDAGELMIIVQELLSKRNESHTALPIVASFGTERTVAQLRKGKKAQSRRSRHEKAFLAALSEKVDFNGVIEWIHNYENNIKSGKEFKGTREAVYNAIHTAIPYLKNVEYNSYYQEFEADVHLDNLAIGKTVHSKMSDGLKAMLNLVAELAFRCVILNGFYGESAVIKTEGVVLIDELDMHLHPNWQRRVIHDLRNAFPSLQFVVTSHSPFIVQSLKREELIILEDDITTDSDPFRRSIEEIASNEMGVEEMPRSKTFLEMEQVAAKYYNLIEQGKTSENDEETAALRNKLNELEDMFSEDPAFVALLKSERKSANL